MKCPKPEILLEVVSIPQEVSWFKRRLLKVHLKTCLGCEKKYEALNKTWEQYLAPEPDITSSLLRVYSRLQKDETLILTGWKLGQKRPGANVRQLLLGSGWLFRGVVGMSLVVAVFVLYLGQNRQVFVADSKVGRRIPLTQIRVEQKNGVRVHYLQPELLQTVEFETASGQ